MNLKTTLVLLVLVVAGGVLFLLGPMQSPDLGGRAPRADAGTLRVLQDDLTSAKLQRIEIHAGEREVVLERGDSGEWSLPGKWPVRKPEVEELVKQLGELRSRFAPLPLEGTNAPALKDLGLDPPDVVVIVVADNKKYRLELGEEPGDSNRFSRPTFLRLGDKQADSWNDRPEVVRLQPGLVAFLDRPLDWYQQRRLFPRETVLKEGSTEEKVDRLSAQSVTLTTRNKDGEEKKPGEEKGGKEKAKETKITLTHKDGDWLLTEPVKDRPDPDKLKSLLTAGADIWAERFLPRPKDAKEYERTLKKCGLDEPQQVLTVVRPGGDTVKLLIGGESDRVVIRTVTDNMEGLPPGQPPRPRKVLDRFRYAKLQDNDQVFEIKAGSLGDVFVGLDTLRDARVARFKSDDVRRVELTQGDKHILLQKKKNADGKEAWRLVQPLDADAEASKITELLDKLANLQAHDEDVIDKGEPKEYGLDAPAGSVTLTLEETKGDSETKATRTLTFQLGKHDKEAQKLYIRLAGWPRINAVQDAVLKLAERPALAYRGRGIFEFPGSDLARIEVQRDQKRYVLKQTDGTWRLTEPVDTAADPQKARPLADELGQLKAVEYVTDAPTPEELETKFGLGKSALTVTISFNDEKKPAKTVLIGKPREGLTGFYAKLLDSPSVFVVAKAAYDDLNRDSLAYRPRELWKVPPEDVAAVRVQRPDEPEFQVKRDETGWKVAGPFEAPVARQQAESLRNSLATLNSERYEAHAAKDLAPFGLDKPHLKLTLVEKGDKPKEHTLLIGKLTGKEPGTRFAKLGDGDAIFVVAQPLVTAFDTGALDLLDRNLLFVIGKNVTRIRSTAGGAMTLERKGDAWQVEAGDVKFTADGATVASLLAVWSDLRAERFAAYGDKADLAKYGLDKPATSVTITVQADKDAKPVEHTLALGKAVADEKGARYARLDNGPGILVLAPLQSDALAHTYLDYVDRTLLKLDAGAITSIVRKMGDDELQLAKRDDGWHIVKPAEYRGDDPSLDKLAESLAKLRAERIAAYPAKDLKEFGLAEPAAVLTLKLGDDDKGRVLKIGSAVKDGDAKSPDRYVLVDGGNAVGVLPGALAAQLLGPPVRFRDRGLAKFADADKAILERGGRKAAFEKIDGTWKLREPVEAEAEQSELDDFVNALARLRADELVAEKPADLKAYGLDKPEARWRFLYGDKEVLSLVLGAHEKTSTGPGPRCFAKLGNGDLVFLLSPALTGRALAEYRSRKLWAPLDPNHVEKLHFGYANRPFELEKADGGWQVVGKPELKVKAGAVSETLAALGGLKAERTVVDKDPDLKLYGLEPPQLVLEVTLREGGKRVLHLGRAEGESKRAYARVTEGRGDVFIISEADGSRILRDLAAFTEGKGK